MLWTRVMANGLGRFCLRSEMKTTQWWKSVMRFQLKAQRGAQYDDCWLWIGGVDKDGYGRHRPGEGLKYMRAHRYSWKLFRGTIPLGMCVLHKCDQRTCVNPDHLFLGSNRNNIDDMMVKNRQRVGTSIEHAKLNDKQVKEIRSYPPGFMSNASLGRQYGVGRNAIRKVRNGETWKHIPLEPPQLEAV